MDDLSDIFSRDFVLRQPSKPAPVAASTTSSTEFSSLNKSRSGWNPTSTSDPFLSGRGAGISDDYVFVGVPDLSNSSSHGQSASSSSAAFDPIFDGFSDSGAKPSSPLPVYDKPVYDDDIFDGVPGTKRSFSVKYEDVFASVLSGSNHVSTTPYEDVLENLGKQMPESKGGSDTRSEDYLKQNFSDFDDLIPGFGGSISTNTKEVQEPKLQKPDVSSTTTTNEVEDPFDVLESVSTSAYMSSGLFSDPLENISRPVNLGSMHSSTNRIFDGDYDFNGGSKSVASSTAETNERQNDKIFPDSFQNKSPTGHDSGMELPERSSADVFANIMAQAKPTKATDLHTPVGRYGLHNTNMDATNTIGDQSPKIYKHVEPREDAWLTVSDIPLYTRPTIAPPPYRAPPPLILKPGHFDVDSKRNNNDYFQHPTQSDPCNGNSVKRSPIDELDDFTSSKPQTYAWHHEEISDSKEELEKKMAAEAAMKEAMDRAEAKLKHAKEVRERERDSKNFSNNEYVQQERNEKANLDGRDLEETEKLERLNQERIQKEREDKEEAKRLEKEREQEAEKQREIARQAAERAIREARERAAAEARQKAERTSAEARQRAERAAVQRAAAEARERAALLARERAEKAAAEARDKAAAEAKERATAEATERTAAEARERAEKAAAEAREIAAAEAREKAAAARERAAAEVREKAANESRERVAVERAAAEARLRAQRAAVERAAAEARERAAAAARDKAAAAAAAAREKKAAASATATAREEQKKEENDLESIFGMGTRATSAPNQRASSSETTFDFKAQNKGVSATSGTSSSSSSSVRKASSTINVVDDLSSIFGVTSSAGEFQEVEGETEERRRARLERRQRAQERAAKALAEKNERDMQVQREQAERHRFAETLDFEIKRWSTGKEGNLRALLSTLQYVLWPGSGWQPVSLTDLITAAAVKKVYRKATLCIHPDKVQQKGANLQQKYIAEKVFDLLKEAWNKFNSEELF